MKPIILLRRRDYLKSSFLSFEKALCSISIPDLPYWRAKGPHWMGFLTEAKRLTDKDGRDGLLRYIEGELEDISNNSRMNNTLGSSSIRVALSRFYQEVERWMVCDLCGDNGLVDVVQLTPADPHPVYGSYDGNESRILLVCAVCLLNALTEIEP